MPRRLLASYVCPWCVRDFPLALDPSPLFVEVACPNCGKSGMKMRRHSGAISTVPEVVSVSANPPHLSSFRKVAEG